MVWAAFLAIVAYLCATRLRFKHQRPGSEPVEPFRISIKEVVPLVESARAGACLEGVSERVVAGEELVEWEVGREQATARAERIDRLLDIGTDALRYPGSVGHAQSRNLAGDAWRLRQDLHAGSPPLERVRSVDLHPRMVENDLHLRELACKLEEFLHLPALVSSSRLARFDDGNERTGLRLLWDLPRISCIGYLLQENARRTNFHAHEGRVTVIVILIVVQCRARSHNCSSPPRVAANTENLDLRNP